MGTACLEVLQQSVVEEEVPQVQLVFRGGAGVAVVVLAAILVCLGPQGQAHQAKEIMEGRGVLSTIILAEVVEVQALQVGPPQVRDQAMAAQA